MATEMRSKGVLATTNDWEMLADIKKQLKFPEEIIHSSLRPDTVLWLKSTWLVKLTVPWEERMGEAHKRKLEKYQALILKCQPGRIEGLEPAGGGWLQGFHKAVTLEDPWTAWD